MTKTAKSRNHIRYGSDDLTPAHTSRARLRTLVSAVADFRQRFIYFTEYCRVVDRRRHEIVFAVGDLAHCAAQDLARAGLRQAGDDECGLEARHRADAIADQLYCFALDLVSRP